MASPQKENGFTAIANELMDALIKVDLSGQEFKIALLIIRKTYGFNKKDDAVSLTQMMGFTGMGKIRCSQVVNRLQLMKIITVTENINGIGKKYKLNKDFEKWDTVNENINRYRKMKSTVNVLINGPLMKTLTTKDTITKDTITKDKNIYARFEKFWKAYPKKKSKGQAEKAWLRARPDEQLLATMIATIERAKKSEEWRREMGKYIPYPATWLNAKGWEDEDVELHPLSGKVSDKTIQNMEMLKEWRPPL